MVDIKNNSKKKSLFNLMGTKPDSLEQIMARNETIAPAPKKNFIEKGFSKLKDTTIGRILFGDPIASIHANKAGTFLGTINERGLLPSLNQLARTYSQKVDDYAQALEKNYKKKNINVPQNIIYQRAAAEVSANKNMQAIGSLRDEFGLSKKEKKIHRKVRTFDKVMNVLDAGDFFTGGVIGSVGSEGLEQFGKAVSKTNEFDKILANVKKTFSKFSKESQEKLTRELVDVSDEETIFKKISDITNEEFARVAAPKKKSTPQPSKRGINAPITDEQAYKTVVHLPEQGIYAKVDPDVARILSDETNNIKFNKERFHLSQVESVLKNTEEAVEVPLKKLIATSDEAAQTIENANDIIRRIDGGASADNFAVKTIDDLSPEKAIERVRQLNIEKNQITKSPAAINQEKLVNFVIGKTDNIKNIPQNIKEDAASFYNKVAMESITADEVDTVIRQFENIGKRVSSIEKEVTDLEGSLLRKTDPVTGETYTPKVSKVVEPRAQPVRKLSGKSEQTPRTKKGQPKTDTVPLSKGEVEVSLPESSTKQTKLSSEVVKKPIIKTNKKLNYNTRFNRWIRETLEDSWIAVKKLLQNEGVKVTNKSNPYLKQTLMRGRMGALEEDMLRTVTKLTDESIKLAKQSKIKPEVFDKMVSDFLYARHAIERNAALGENAAGITTKNAEKMLEELSKNKEAVDIAEKWQDINNEVLDILVEGEIITEDLAKTLRNKYKNHVPLQRIMDDATEEQMIGAFSKKGMGVVGSSPIKSAKGSDRGIRDIKSNIVNNYLQAIHRAEKNKVNISSYKMFKENPESLGHLFKEVKPTPIGKSFDGERILFKPPTDDPLVIPFRLAGEQKYIRVNDPMLARSLQDLNKWEVPSYVRALQTITRYYSGLATWFNIEFAATNIVRDAMDLAVNTAGDTKSLRGGAEAVTRIPDAIQDVAMWVAGKDTKGAREYAEMRKYGGTTGGTSLYSRGATEDRLKNIVINRNSSGRKIVSKVFQKIDDYNRVIEDATRLAAYRQAKSAGLSLEEAAIRAKNATVNFDKKGTASPIINALYMFANASIQGSVRTMQSLRDPKVLTAVAGTTGAAVYAVYRHNDAIDPDWRDKVRRWDKANNLVVMLPPNIKFKKDGTKYEKIRYITIPVSFGIKPIKVFMEQSYDAFYGKDTASNIASESARALLESYNPVGGTDWFSTLIPTPLDLPAEIARNKAWHGGLIFPDWKKGLTGPEQVFGDFGESLSDKSFNAVSSGLESIGLTISPEILDYTLRALGGGALKATQRAADTVGAIVTGNDLNPSDTLYVNRFLKNQTSDRIDRNIQDKQRDELMSQLRKYKPSKNPDFEEARKDLIRDYLRDIDDINEKQSLMFFLREKGVNTKNVSISEHAKRPKFDDSWEDWYGYYRSPKFNYTRQEAENAANDVTQESKKAPDGSAEKKSLEELMKKSKKKSLVDLMSS